jgi:hypothetical protein
VQLRLARMREPSRDNMAGAPPPPPPPPPIRVSCWAYWGKVANLATLISPIDDSGRERDSGNDAGKREPAHYPLNA